VTKRTFDLRLAQVDKRFAQVDKRFAPIDKRFDQIDMRFNQVDKRFVQIDQRFRELERTLPKKIVESQSELATMIKNGLDEFNRAVKGHDRIPVSHERRILTIEDDLAIVKD
jgi:hypothetical protein